MDNVVKKKRSQKRGLPPGTLVHIGETPPGKPRITVIDYTSDNVETKQVQEVSELAKYTDKNSVTWVNIDGIHDTKLIQQIGDLFKIHPLILEDIVNTEQRPKIEDFQDYIYIVLKMLYLNEKNEIIYEQISLILSSKFVISFQEREGDVFDPVRERIKSGQTSICKKAPDYLTYRLMDAIVDNYFTVLEVFGEKIEYLENKIIQNPTADTMKQIYQFKRDMILLRKSIWPLRDVISKLERGESHLIHKTTAIYLRDIYDHTIQVIDTVEAYRDMISGILDIYLSSVSNRMNEVMKVLTVFASIFIPLTFVTGVYGMNFQYMPELTWRYGYYIIWGVMLAVAAVLLAFFRKLKWI